MGRDKYVRKWQTSSRVYSPRILVSASILRFGWQVLVILHFHNGHRTAIKSQISERPRDQSLSRQVTKLRGLKSSTGNQLDLQTMETQSRLEAATEASKAGNVIRAEEIYREILSKPPTTNEAALRESELALTQLGELYKEQKYLPPTMYTYSNNSF